MVYFIPSNFDVEQHILTYPPTDIERFSQDKLHHILSLIIAIPAKNKDYRYGRGYVPLMANKLMQAIGNNYRQYLNYLTDTGVLEEDRQYIVDEKPRCFRLTEKYRQSFQEVPLSSHAVDRVKRLNYKTFKKLFQQDVYKPYKHLFKWLENDKLHLDLIAAQSFLNKFILQGARLHNDSEEKVQQRQTEVNRFNRQRKGQHKVKKAKLTRRERKIHKYFSTLQAAHRLANFKFKSPFKVDDKAGRLHTPLTGLKKELRNFLTYDGKRLVEIDIKNSQPFFSLALLHGDFWAQEKKGKAKNCAETRFMSLNSNRTNNMNITYDEQQVYRGTITYEKLIKEGKLTHCMYDNVSKRSSLIMIYNMVEDIDKEEVSRYRKLVISGMLYDVLLESYVEKTGRADMDRDKMKKVMFTILFSENEKDNVEQETVKQFKIRHQREIAKDLFRDLFPTINSLFEKLKEDDNAVLACLLQTIEATVMLDRVCKRIKRERRALPIYTIHDSILTTEGNEGYVRRVMEEEFMKSIGAVPGMTVKLLCPENLEPKLQRVA